MSESSKTPLISLSFPTSATSCVQVAIWENRVNVASGSTDRNRERPTGAVHLISSGSSHRLAGLPPLRGWQSRPVHCDQRVMLL